MVHICEIALSRKKSVERMLEVGMLARTFCSQNRFTVFPNSAQTSTVFSSGAKTREKSRLERISLNARHMPWKTNEHSLRKGTKVRDVLFDLFENKK